MERKDNYCTKSMSLQIFRVIDTSIPLVLSTQYSAHFTFGVPKCTNKRSLITKYMHSKNDPQNFVAISIGLHDYESGLDFK